MGYLKIKSDNQLRSEQEVFEDLRSICQRPGFIHALAYLAFKNSFMPLSDLAPEVLAERSANNELIRTEISTLIGLFLTGERDLSHPGSQAVQQLADRAEELLAELHEVLAAEMVESMFARESLQSDEPKLSGRAWREPIFYGAESAYSFQYESLALTRYENDNDWLVQNCGFDIKAASKIAKAIAHLVESNLESCLRDMRSEDPEQWSVFSGFVVTEEQIVEATGCAAEEVKSFLDWFSADTVLRNTSFKSLSDFNVANARPLISLEGRRYLLLQPYQLLESLYESPFYWMGADQSYCPEAMKNRGEFTERFAESRLQLVFGSKNVFRNVELVNSYGNVVGEIDVLVVFGSKAIILQAKSKRLTIEARKGNDGQLQDDFEKAVQAAYDQAEKNARQIIDRKVEARDGTTGKKIKMGSLAKIYPVCVVADHYPALTVQARHMLRTAQESYLASPFVMDVFFLDVSTELLNTPLHFLSYIDRRTGYSDAIFAFSEYPILAYHLKQNLWLSPDVDLMQLSDDLTADVDIAMMVRRAGIDGNGTPEGILTRYEETTLSRILEEASEKGGVAAIDFGFLVLELSEEWHFKLSDAIDECLKKSRGDGDIHDVTVGFQEKEAGITIHCNTFERDRAEMKLLDHCARRKYAQRAARWYGLCLDTESGSLRFGCEVVGVWEKDEKMEAAVAEIPSMKWRSPILGKWVGKTFVRDGRKPGRNERCPCGSGLKYKKCHGKPRET